jgi:hypothetical protein
MIQGIEVMRVVKKQTKLFILFMDPDQTALYIGKKKEKEVSEEYPFVSIKEVIKGDATVPNTQLHVMVGDTSRNEDLVFQVDTERSRNIIVDVLGRLTKCCAIGKADGVAMQSYMQIRTVSGLAKWAKGYFVLEDQNLKCYDAKFTSVVKRTYWMGGLRSCMRGVNDRKTFQLRFDDMKLEMRCDNAEHITCWVKAFQPFVVAPEDGTEDEPTLDASDLAPLSLDASELAFENGSSGDRSGVLWKRALRSGRNWQRRHFVLTENTLSYYIVGKMSETAKGILYLTGDSSVRAGQGDVDNSFIVVTPQQISAAGKILKAKVLFAAAEREEQAKSWISAIQERIDCLPPAVKPEGVKRRGSKRQEKGLRTGEGAASHTPEKKMSTKERLKARRRRSITMNNMVGYMHKRAIKSG